MPFITFITHFIDGIFQFFILSLDSLELYQSNTILNIQKKNEEEDWCPLYKFDSEFPLIKLTDGDTMHGKNIANEILCALISFLFLS